MSYSLEEIKNLGLELKEINSIESWLKDSGLEYRLLPIEEYVSNHLFEGITILETKEKVSLKPGIIHWYNPSKELEECDWLTEFKRKKIVQVYQILVLNRFKNSQQVLHLYNSYKSKLFFRTNVLKYCYILSNL